MVHSAEADHQGGQPRLFFVDEVSLQHRVEMLRVLLLKFQQERTRGPIW
jgi:hypothetical protein